MMPTKQGQICKIINPKPDENPFEAYIVTEDVKDYPNGAIIQLVSITNLQRNISNPSLAPRKAIAKNELDVEAEDLKSYVESWNKK